MVKNIIEQACRPSGSSEYNLVHKEKYLLFVDMSMFLSGIKLDDIYARIEELEMTTADIETLKSTTANLSAGIDALENTTANLSTGFEVLKTTVTTVESKINNLNVVNGQGSVSIQCANPGDRGRTTGGRASNFGGYNEALGSPSHVTGYQNTVNVMRGEAGGWGSYAGGPNGAIAKGKGVASVGEFSFVIGATKTSNIAKVAGDLFVDKTDNPERNFGSLNNKYVTRTKEELEAAWDAASAKPQIGAGDFCFVGGFGNLGLGEGSFTFGEQNKTTAKGGVTVGVSNKNRSGVIFGFNNETDEGTNAFIRGFGNKAKVLLNAEGKPISSYYGVVFGNNNVLNGGYTVILGNDNESLQGSSEGLIVGVANKTKHKHQTVVGRGNDYETDALFVVGNGHMGSGNQVTTRKNAFEVLSKATPTIKIGNTELSETQLTKLLALLS